MFSAATRSLTLPFLTGGGDSCSTAGIGLPDGNASPPPVLISPPSCKIGALDFDCDCWDMDDATYAPRAGEFGLVPPRDESGVRFVPCLRINEPDRVPSRRTSPAASCCDAVDTGSGGLAKFGADAEICVPDGDRVPVLGIGNPRKNPKSIGVLSERATEGLLLCLTLDRVGVCGSSEFDVHEVDI